MPETDLDAEWVITDARAKLADLQETAGRCEGRLEWAEAKYRRDQRNNRWWSQTPNHPMVELDHQRFHIEELKGALVSVYMAISRLASFLYIFDAAQLDPTLPDVVCLNRNEYTGNKCDETRGHLGMHSSQITERTRRYWSNDNGYDQTVGPPATPEV